MEPKKIIRLFDEYLAKKKLSFEAIVIGGAALNVMSIINRDTVDIDCLDPKIPEEICEAAIEFRREHPDLKLIDKWLNNGPESLIRDLDDGWRVRTTSLYVGEAIRFQTLGRIDLLKTKLFAYCDRDQDLGDCIALKPTKDELEICIQWVAERDGNPAWPKHVEKQFSVLEKHLRFKEPQKGREYED